ncbi:MAG TPA: NAD-glutamate dehydrogenase [Xanthomonadaceae bacterium]|nr:NAD-glutamate dehydrogenase [Xanthomonadaceae bacterium]
MSANAAVAGHLATLDSVLLAIGKRVSGPRHKEAESFARLFLQRVPDDELAGRSADEWAALICDLLGFMRQRRPDSPKVRVFNPEMDAHGWESTHTVVQIVNDDMPFLVDSVGMVVAQSDAVVHSIHHPVMVVERDPGGHLLAIHQAGSDKGRRESLIHMEMDRQAEPAELSALALGIESALADVRLCVVDWKPMREKMQRIATELPERGLPMDAEGIAEAKAFLDWVADDHFTYLGYREYEVTRVDGEDMLRAIEGSGLGILRSEDRRSPPRSLSTLAAHGMQQSGSVDALILTKTNARATVHRPGYMDYIGILRFDESGRAIGEQRFIGLYSSAAYNRRPWEIPLVRQRFAAVMQRSGLTTDGHGGKALKHILETLPREELFQATTNELFDISVGILNLQERQRTRLFVRQDRYGRFFSCLVFIPRDRFNTSVRMRIEALFMEAFQGERLDTQVQISESSLARVHVIVRPVSGAQVQYNMAELEARISQIVRNWHDELRDRLVERNGEDRGLKLANRFGKALPAGYVEHATPEIAAADVECAAALRDGDDIRILLYRPARSDDELVRIKLFRYGGIIPLSDALPLLESMGLRVVSEHPFQMDVHGAAIYIQEFEVGSAAGGVLDPDAVRERFVAAFERLWRGELETDGFNRLIIEAGLDWRQVSMLRAYCKYLLQANVPFSQAYMEETLCSYPTLSRLLVELFEAKFDPYREVAADEAGAVGAALVEGYRRIAPAGVMEKYGAAIDAVAASRGADRQAQIEAAWQALATVLDRVTSLDQDRIIRSFKACIRASLRTNYYQFVDGRPHDYISFKFDPALLPDLPKPKPFREIFVCSPRVEGTHLRFGPVARGGLRWSDRREDFRTEVLGLVKAQMVKNTVIVPVGAKGGFFVKRPPAGGDRDQVLAEGVACYRMFINGLLDITDNLVDGAVVHPERVVRHDADDPYLVVAADKGTATFSDIANAVSAEYGFWMGDAFASGGSQGYDHKGMGITAKGAWESVKRHFRALGVDSQGEDFTCVGIGDMSGDVFGNGMLLSKHIRLIAAFDHRHIFIDPDPDSATSYAERERMFRLPRSSWEDYDRNLISTGGGIYPRSAKIIDLSPEARAALGIEAEGAMTPNEVMRAILLAPVDLLWNGGIGTYVKAASETHGDVGDRANNAIRVDGRELRCRVVGEGGNLGLTQQGRIEAALAGVLLNTDFIDNSAGVDTSDHEVNIKILLNDAVQRGELDMEARNALLAAMTDEVERLVLWDNYRQNQAISMMERMSVPRLGAKQHFIRVLESQGLLDRQLEYLPSDVELTERKSRGMGLTRPELSILLSYSKIVAYQQLLDSDVPEDPYLSKELARYFPQPLQVRFAEHMERHRLRREIIATAVTNSLVNRMGATFMLRMQEDTGESPGQVAKAYTVAREVLDARGLWEDIDALDLKVSDSAQIDALLQIWALLRHATRWLLNQPGQRLDIAGSVERYGAGVAEVWNCLDAVVAEPDRIALQADRERWCAAGFPEALAGRLAGLPALTSVLDIVETATEKGVPVRQTAEIHFALGEVLHLKWLMDRIEGLEVEGRWHANARGSLRDELLAQQRALTGHLLRDGSCADPRECVEEWANQDDPALRFTLAMFADMRSQVRMDYATVLVAVRRLAQLVQSVGRV